MMEMTPTEMRDCLDALKWGQRELARRLGSNEASVRQMARGTREIPGNLADWLRELSALHRAKPLPVGWPATRSVDTSE